MGAEHDFPATQVHHCVRRFRPDAHSIHFTPVPTGKFNTSFFVQADGEELVLRIAPPADSVFLFYERDMMRQEPGLHRLLRRETSVPVPHIVGYADGDNDVGRAYLLMERLPGRPLSDCPGVDHGSILKEVGTCLSAVHGLQRDRYGYLGEHAPMPPQRSWAAAFRLMWRALLDDVVAVGHYSIDERNRLAELLERHLPSFDRPVPACLLHMDVWSQNLLVGGDGRLSGILDWDRALWGDPEIEYAVLDYCGISRPSFWRGYGGERDTSPAAEVRRVFYLLYEIQKYIVIREGRGRDSAEARRYVRWTREILARSFGVDAVPAGG